jgi:hypothetical protein
MISVGKNLVTIKKLGPLESTSTILEVLFGETLKNGSCLCRVEQPHLGCSIAFVVRCGRHGFDWISMPLTALKIPQIQEDVPESHYAGLTTSSGMLLESTRHLYSRGTRATEVSIEVTLPARERIAKVARKRNTIPQSMLTARQARMWRFCSRT